MKRLLSLAGLVFLFSVMVTTVSAQEGSDYKNAIGARLGGGYYDVNGKQCVTVIRFSQTNILTLIEV